MSGSFVYTSGDRGRLTVPSGAEESPPSNKRWTGSSQLSERAGKGAETTQPLDNAMIRQAMRSLADLVRRRLPTGASPNSESR